MTTTDAPTLDQVLTLARKLPVADKVRLIARLAPEVDDDNILAELDQLISKAAAAGPAAVDSADLVSAMRR